MTYFYLRFSLADNGCSGLMDLFFDGFFFILFVVSIVLSFRATLRKRELYKRKPEPITLTITLVALLILIIGKAFGDDFKGSKWIYAETSRQQLSTQNLTLRKNGTFKVDLNEIEFSCYFSGQYQNRGDTIILDKDIIEQTHSLLTTKYLLLDTLLIPVNDNNRDSTKFGKFVIRTKR